MERALVELARSSPRAGCSSARHRRRRRWSPAAPTRPASPPASSACSAAESVARAPPQLRPARRRRRRRGARRATLCARAADRPARRAAASRSSGNLQAAAREARYDAAERLRDRTGADWIATGHTRTDVAETVLYRLASSPGTRALLGLRAAERPGDPAAAAARARGDARARRAPPGCRSSTTRPTPSRATPATGSAPRSCRVLREIEPGGRAQHRRDPRRARRGGRAARARRARGARRGRLATPARCAIAAERAERAASPACAGWRCARSPSAPPAGRSPLGRARAAEILRLARRTRRAGRVELGGGLVALVRAGVVRFRVDGPRRRAEPDAA